MDVQEIVVHRAHVPRHVIANLYDHALPLNTGVHASVNVFDIQKRKRFLVT